MIDKKNNGIKVYCRLRPLLKKDKLIKYEIKNEHGFDLLKIDFQKTNYDQKNNYQYHRVFNEHITQNTIFQNVAVSMLNKFNTGINATIFTYGQTSSGKTHTIYGSKEDRGIIPRSFEFIFNSTSTENIKNRVYKLSFIEIYKEIIYDLLNTNKRVPLNIPMSYRIGKNGEIHLKNLNEHIVHSESEALNLLKLGNSRKRVSATLMNDRSSRSHSICTISYTNNMNNVTKLNFVDLAGSERFCYSNGNKDTMADARSINLSLHNLNQVINKLAKPRHKMHVPYRNSIMTSILRGSLGGNCSTAMIATLILNKQCISESISTCRFSKQVAAVKKIPGKIHEKIPVNYSANDSSDLRKTVKTLTQNNESLKKQFDEVKIELDSLKRSIIDDHDALNVRLGYDRQLEHNHLVNEDINSIPAVDVLVVDSDDGASDNQKTENNLAMGDVIFSVPAVDVLAPIVIESGDGTRDNQKNEVDLIEFGRNCLKEVGDMVNCGVKTRDTRKCYRPRANAKCIYYNPIVLVIILMAMCVSPWSHKSNTDTEDFYCTNVKTQKCQIKSFSVVNIPEDSAGSFEDGLYSNHYFKTINDENCDIREEFNSTSQYGCIFVFVLITIMVLFKLCRSWWTSKLYANHTNNDNFVVNTPEKSKQPRPTTGHISPVQLPVGLDVSVEQSKQSQKRCIILTIDENCTKVEYDTNNSGCDTDEFLQTFKTSAATNHITKGSPNVNKRYGFRRWH